MAKREAFDLKPLVVLWNIILAVFSISGALVVVPNVIRTAACRFFLGWAVAPPRSRAPDRRSPGPMVPAEHALETSISQDLCDKVTEQKDLWYGRAWLRLCSPPKSCPLFPYSGFSRMCPAGC